MAASETDTNRRGMSDHSPLAILFLDQGIPRSPSQDAECAPSLESPGNVPARGSWDLPNDIR